MLNWMVHCGKKNPSSLFPYSLYFNGKSVLAWWLRFNVWQIFVSLNFSLFKGGFEGPFRNYLATLLSQFILMVFLSRIHFRGLKNGSQSNYNMFEKLPGRIEEELGKVFNVPRIPKWVFENVPQFCSNDLSIHWTFWVEMYWNRATEEQLRMICIHNSPALKSKYVGDCPKCSSIWLFWRMFLRIEDPKIPFFSRSW